MTFSRNWVSIRFLKGNKDRCRFSWKELLQMNVCRCDGRKDAPVSAEDQFVQQIEDEVRKLVLQEGSILSMCLLFCKTHLCYVMRDCLQTHQPAHCGMLQTKESPLGHLHALESELTGIGGSQSHVCGENSLKGARSQCIRTQPPGQEVSASAS